MIVWTRKKTQAFCKISASSKLLFYDIVFGCLWKVHISKHRFKFCNAPNKTLSITSRLLFFSLWPNIAMCIVLWLTLWFHLKCGVCHLFHEFNNVTPPTHEIWSKNKKSQEAFFSVGTVFAIISLSLPLFVALQLRNLLCTHRPNNRKKRLVSAKCRKQSSKQQKMEKKKKKFKLTLAQASPIADTNYQTVGHKAHCSLRFPLCAVLFISLFFSHPRRHSLQKWQNDLFSQRKQKARKNAFRCKITRSRIVI